MKEEVVYCGIDVAKEQLDVALRQERWRVPNSKEGIAQLLRRFKGQRLKLHVICEASGGYEKAIVTALQRSGVVVSLAQANRVRQFARAAGILAKTNRIDALVLVRKSCFLSLKKSKKKRQSPENLTSYSISQ